MREAEAAMSAGEIDWREVGPVGTARALLRRDLLLARRDGGALGTALGFYLLVVALLPLGLGPDLALLSRIAPGVLWIALLLAALLSLGRLFVDDRDDGSLDVLATSGEPLALIVASKAVAHWLTTALPLVAATPLLALLLNLELSAHVPLVVAMLVGTPAVSFLGMLGAALTLSTRRGGLLMALVVLPLYVPTLIFGISTVAGATVGAGGGGYGASLAILGAVTLASMVLAPLAAAAALRLHLQ
jgi:heme exporter protein B